MRVGRRAVRQGGPVERTVSVREALEMNEDILTDFSIDELREFLEADLVDVKVDPEFKERLRRQLWELLQDRARRTQSSGSN
jgi:hypothetical protein